MGDMVPAKRVVRVVGYDPAWPSRFEEESGRIRAALGDLALRIDHIGSTAVPGLAAKPIIDISVAVSALDPEAPYREPLERMGYEYGVQAFFEEERYFKLNRDGRRVANLHLTLFGSAFERRHLAFRDALRGEPETAAAYERLKLDLARRFPEDRIDYTGAKTAFIEGVLARVLGASSAG